MHDLRAIAIHEAGHAVAAQRLFPDCGAVVTIVPAEDALGYFAPAVRTPDDFERRAVVCACGYAALVAAGYEEGVAALGAGSDFERIESHWRQPLEQTKRAAVALMREPVNVAAVAVLANKLLRLRTIRGADIGRVIAGWSTEQEDYEEEDRMRALAARYGDEE